MVLVVQSTGKRFSCNHANTRIISESSQVKHYALALVTYKTYATFLLDEKELFYHNVTGTNNFIGNHVNNYHGVGGAINTLDHVLLNYLQWN